MRRVEAVQRNLSTATERKIGLFFPRQTVSAHLPTQASPIRRAPQRQFLSRCAFAVNDEIAQ
jgi:hypothetical protein